MKRQPELDLDTNMTNTTTESEKVSTTQLNKRVDKLSADYDSELHDRAIRILHTIGERVRNSKNIPMNIGVKYVYNLLKTQTKCPYLEVELEQHNGINYNPNARSLDRIKPELGYVEGNVRFISLRANQIKSDCTEEQLRLFFKNYFGKDDEKATD